MTVYRLTAAVFAMSAALAIAAQSARAEPVPSHRLRHEHVRPFSPLDDLPQYRADTPPSHGLPAGKRQYKPLLLSKQIDADTPSIRGIGGLKVERDVIEHKPGGRLKVAIKK